MVTIHTPAVGTFFKGTAGTQIFRVRGTLTVPHPESFGHGCVTQSLGFHYLISHVPYFLIIHCQTHIGAKANIHIQDGIDIYSVNPLSTLRVKWFWKISVPYIIHRTPFSK